MTKKKIENTYILLENANEELVKSLSKYPEILNRGEVLEILDINFQTLRRWREKGYIKCVDIKRTGDKVPLYRYFKSDIIKKMSVDKLLK